MSISTVDTYTDIHAAASAQLRKWLKQSAPRKPAGVFMYGPPGIGKTTLAYHVLRSEGYDIVELNASHFRTKQMLQKLVHPILHTMNIRNMSRKEPARTVAILMDEIDGMSSGEKGGLKEIIEILRDHVGPQPIICISNESAEKRYLPLKKLCLNIPLVSVSADALAGYVRTFRPDAPDEEISAVVDVHTYDLRKIKQTMQLSLAENHSVASDTIPNIVQLFFNAQLGAGFRTTLPNTDENMVGLHVHENILPFLGLRGGEISDEERIRLYSIVLDKIGKADTIDFYTFNYQQWALFPISMLLKLHHPNSLLRQLIPDEDVPEGYVEYVPKRKTAIISKQSILFNQYTSLAALKIKMRCSQHDVLYWIATMRRCETATQWQSMRSSEVSWLPLGKLTGLTSTELRKLAGCYWLDGKGREWKPPTAKKTVIVHPADLFSTAYDDLVGTEVVEIVEEPVEDMDIPEYDEDVVEDEDIDADEDDNDDDDY